jgi:putative colanic acid biosynthesis acetyltransferase WcaF
MEIKTDLSQYSHTFSLKNKLARLLWNFAYLIIFRPFSGRFFKKWRIIVLRCFGAKITWKVHVYASVKIWAPWNLRMDDYSTLGPFVDCYNQGMLSIGAHTTISQKTYLCASSHDFTDPHFNLILQPITIGNQVWVAADAFIGPGVNIGEGAVVGARSAVFKEVAPWTVVGGNPSIFIKNREIKI